MTTTRSRSTGTDADLEHPLAEAGQEAGETAGHLAERATSVGFQQADRAREQTAEGLDKLAESVRRVSSDIEGEQPMIANLTMTAAEQTDRIASFLRETDTRQLVHTVEDVARRQPLLFVGGAFLLGLAASRFIKAAGGGSTSGSQGAGRYGYGAGYGGTGYGAGTGFEATGPGGPGRVGDTTDGLGAPTDEGLRP